MWLQGVIAVAAQAAGQTSLLLNTSALPGQCQEVGSPREQYSPCHSGREVPSCFDLICCDQRDIPISQMCYGKVSHN